VLTERNLDKYAAQCVEAILEGVNRNDGIPWFFIVRKHMAQLLKDEHEQRDETIDSRFPGRVPR
jgi:hypothetical protein